MKATLTRTMAEQMQEQCEIAADLLKAMANPQRLRVLCLLIEGERTVSEINDTIPISQSALSQHLAVLRQRSLVQTRREAQTIFYSLADGAALGVMRVLHDAYCGTQKK